MSGFFPTISPALQAIIRTGYGVLMLGTLVWAWPHRRRFFLSDRWDGYADSRLGGGLFHNPVAYPMVLSVWAACCAGLVMNVAVVPAALINVLLCRYYFVRMAWKGLLRGMGAPGFMSYWLGAGVLLLEYTARHASDLRGVALLVLQVDFAFIMASAGIYKATGGYARNQGMDFGMVNPQWGYWWRQFRKLSPGHWVFPVLNHLAWTTEVLAAILMLIPQTRAMGGLLITVSFLFIATQIRLAWLTEMMMLCGLLFVPPGHIVDRWISSALSVTPVHATPAPWWVNGLLAVALWGYLALLPLAHAGLFYNYYGRARLWEPLQRLLERYTNFFGIIIWRVFSVDHLNFFVRIYEQQRADGRRTLLSRYGSWRTWRFSHVGECIVVTTVFTTLKYYPTQPALFEARLRRYARSLLCSADNVLVFQYVSVRKHSNTYEHMTTVEYVFDPTTESITTIQVEPGFDVHAAHYASPVHEGVSPGSYAPATR
jgi:hypothetical protein